MTLMLRQPLPLLDNDVLRTFVAIAETGSFTTAADRVYRTPSAVSMQIKKLEEQLNTTLFLRDARSVRLTAGGETLLPYARRMLALSEDMRDQLAAGGGVRGLCRFGVGELAAPPDRMTDRLLHWASVAPDRSLFARREAAAREHVPRGA